MQRTGSETSRSSADQERLVRDNLPLVHHAVAGVAARIPRHIPRDDLVSAAMLALAQAARSFDDSKGVPFERFAMVRIRGAVIDELRAVDWAGRPTRTAGRRLAAAEDSLAAQLGRRPTPDEVAAHVGLDPAAVHRLRHDLDRATVLNYDALATIGGSEDVLPAVGANPEDLLVERERRAYLFDAVAALPERLRAVVVGYFLDERPMAEIGEELGVTESRVSQMRAQALALLRDGVSTHLDLDLDKAAGAARSDGIAARRRAAYCADIATRSDYRSRLSSRPVVVPRAS